jgi:hypothetical protein
VTEKVRKPKRKRTGTPAAPLAAAAPANLKAPPEPASEIASSNLSLHELFEQQAAEMLDRADLDEEQKQSIMLAMSCPCCGGGGPSFSFKLKPRR